MKTPIPVRLPEKLQEKLKEEAGELGISLSQVIRNHVGQSIINESKNTWDKKECDDFCPHPEKPLRESHPLLIETVFLLRQLCLRADSQILRKVDADLDALLGKQRKKIYED